MQICNKVQRQCTRQFTAMQRSNWLKLLIAAMGLSAATSAGLAEDCGQPSPRHDQWQIADANSVGLDTLKLCALAQRLSNPSNTEIHSLLIVRDGKLAFEWYGAGRDLPWGKMLGEYRYDANTRHDVRSISKSVVGLLIGIAVDQKLIRSIDDSIFDYLPQYADLRTPEKQQVRIVDLLTMTSGFVANEAVPYENAENTERLIAQSADPYRIVLERKLLSRPGSDWVYNGGNTMLLSAILQGVSGKTLVEFATEKLFQPLRIENFEWIGLKASGQTAAYGSLRLIPRDLAKSGQLVLDGGLWNGRRIVSRDWIEEATRPRFDGWFPDRYGYQWWVGNSETATKRVDWIAGVGIGGQRLYIVPQLRLVATINGWIGADQGSVTRNLLEGSILSAVK